MDTICLESVFEYYIFSEIFYVRKTKMKHVNK